MFNKNQVFNKIQHKFNIFFKYLLFLLKKCYKIVKENKNSF